MIDPTAFFLSGGAANADPNAALGGARSSSRLLCQPAAWDAGAIPGVTLVDGCGNPIGSGLLTYDPARGIAWRPPGIAYQTNFEAVADGENTIGYLDQVLRLDVVSASLPGTISAESVTVSAQASNSLLDNVPKQEAVEGRTEYRAFYLLNQAASAATFTVWLKRRPASGAVIALGLEPQVDACQTVVDETTAPVGVAFSAPYSEGAGLVLNLAAGEAQAIWLERQVPALLITTATDRIQIDYAVA